MAFLNYKYSISNSKHNICFQGKVQPVGPFNNQSRFNLILMQAPSCLSSSMQLLCHPFTALHAAFPLCCCSDCGDRSVGLRPIRQCCPAFRDAPPTDPYLSANGRREGVHALKRSLAPCICDCSASRDAPRQGPHRSTQGQCRSSLLRCCAQS